MQEHEKGRGTGGVAGGGDRHLVDIYAHNTVLEVIKNARDSAAEERGRFTLPSEFMDSLVVECGRWILDKGAEEAERSARLRIYAFLSSREMLRNQQDEKKVSLMLEGRTRD